MKSEVHEPRPCAVCSKLFKPWNRNCYCCSKECSMIRARELLEVRTRMRKEADWNSGNSPIWILDINNDTAYLKDNPSIREYYGGELEDD